MLKNIYYSFVSIEYSRDSHFVFVCVCLSPSVSLSDRAVEQ